MPQLHRDRATVGEQLNKKRAKQLRLERKSTALQQGLNLQRVNFIKDIEDNFPVVFEEVHVLRAEKRVVTKLQMNDQVVPYANL